MLSMIMCSAGIGYSDDKLLQTRIFSYADTQRHRLGPNYLLLPVNAPKCPHHNNHHDGFMNFMHRDEEARPHAHMPSWLTSVTTSEQVLAGAGKAVKPLNKMHCHTI